MVEITETTPFPNSVEFGEFIAALRGRVSRETVARHGGPSDTYQARIEGGDEMQISPDTIAKYSAAFSSMSFAEVTPSFFTAAARAFSEWPGSSGSARLSSADPDPDWGFRVGNVVPESGTASPKELYAGRLARARGHLASALTELRGHGTTFLDVVAGVAAKHRAVTLIPWSVAANDRKWTGYWWQEAHGSQPSAAPYARVGAYPDGLPRRVIDPIAGVSSLEQAHRRANALGASGEDRTFLAWAILLANADSACAVGESPIESWMRGYTGRGKGTGPFVDVEKRDVWGPIVAVSGYAPPITVVRERSAKYLFDWVDQWVMSHNLRFERPADSDDRKLIDWCTDNSERPEIPTDSDQALAWFYDDEGALRRLPDVLADQGMRSLVLTTEGLSAPWVSGPTYLWYPITRMPSWALVREDDGEDWYAVQMY